MRLYTVGFTQKTAEQFFSLLVMHGVNCLVDIRLHPDGQLAGFTKQVDLPYFLEKLVGCRYRYLPALAPTQAILKRYRADKNWDAYAYAYTVLLKERGIPDSLDRALFEENTCCLLCSEPTPARCHRRLAAEKLASSWPDVTIIHI